MEGYDRLASERYLEAFAGNASRQLITQRLDTFLSQQASGQRIIDFGCGTGEDSLLSDKYDHDYYGIDLSRDIISIGREHGVTKTLVADVERTPFQDNTFSVAISLWALQYKENLQSTLSEWTRVMDNNAKLFLVLPHPVYKFARYSKNYFSEGPQLETGLGIRRVNYYHSFSDYLNSLFVHGVSINSVEETRRTGTGKDYDGMLKDNIPHDIIIEGTLEK